MDTSFKLDPQVSLTAIAHLAASHSCEIQTFGDAQSLLGGPEQFA